MATSIKIVNDLENRMRPPEAHDGLAQEAAASWQVCQETRRHLTGQEIRAWLNGWATQAQAVLPECQK